MPSHFINLDEYRDGKGYIDLLKAYEDIYNIPASEIKTKGERYLYQVMRIQPTKSRQASAIAIVTAYALDGEL